MYLKVRQSWNDFYRGHILKRRFSNDFSGVKSISVTTSVERVIFSITPLLELLFVSTVYFQIISSYVNVQTKSGSTPCVVTGCALRRQCSSLFVLTLYFQVVSSYVKVQKKSGTTPYVVAGCAFRRWCSCRIFFVVFSQSNSSYADSTIYVQSCLRLHAVQPWAVLFEETVRMGSFLC